MLNSGVLLVGATVSAAIIMVFFFHAPIAPVAVGAVAAALIIIRRMRSS
ncbi:hypothetical protein [Candidatus Binatus sp.]|nr:hypothetical protein [Candidatus Binatus sp.]